MRHYKVDGGADIAKLAYARDYSSAPKYQEDLVNSAADELYAYDSLVRLTNVKRGNLNETRDAILSTPAREQTWTLDTVGNWAAIDSNADGDPGSPTDARTHNTSNEILTIDPEGEVAQFSVVHDDAGNVRFLPDRTDPANEADKMVYDYRNRLIQIWHTTDYDPEDPEGSDWGEAPVVRYYYDAFNRRIKKVLTTGNDVVYLLLSP